MPQENVIRVYRRPRVNRTLRTIAGAGIGGGAGIGAGVGALSGGGYKTIYQRTSRP